MRKTPRCARWPPIRRWFLRTSPQKRWEGSLFFVRPDSSRSENLLKTHASGHSGHPVSEKSHWRAHAEDSHPAEAKAQKKGSLQPKPVGFFARPQGRLGPMPIMNKSKMQRGVVTTSKNGRPTEILSPLKASTIKGKSVPKSTVKVKATRSKLLTRMADSRLAGLGVLSVLASRPIVLQAGQCRKPC